MDSVVVVATVLVVSSVVDVITTLEVHRINLICNLRVSGVTTISLMGCVNSDKRKSDIMLNLLGSNPEHT